MLLITLTKIIDSYKTNTFLVSTISVTITFTTFFISKNTIKRSINHYVDFIIKNNYYFTQTLMKFLLIIFETLMFIFAGRENFNIFKTSKYALQN